MYRRSHSFFERGEDSTFNRKLAFLFICAGVLINCTGLLGTVFSGDSALYAVISKSFVSSGNFLDIYVDGRDWLDKPHFPFWLAALSMKIFGVSGFAYKLPSILLFVVGLIYTYKLAESLYDRDRALLAVLILTYSLHILISNNDVRAESILIGLIMGGIYHFYRSCSGGGIIHIVLGSLFCAAAIMTKGPFVIIVFGAAILGFLVGKRDYAAVFSWRWMLAALLTFVFVLPELVSLYRQFDMHPEKEILGATNVSGLKFFVWDTQFGRFFNSGPFKGSGSLAFYFHTMLWAFAPWALIGYVMFGKRIADIFRRRQATEYLTVSGFAVMFVVFSVSKFQLPYYVNILFPFLAIICANGILTDLPASRLGKHVLHGLSTLFVGVLIPLAAAMEWAFNGRYILIAALGTVLFAGVLALILRLEKQLVFRAVYFAAAAIGLFALYANFVFYPRLLRYQSGSEAAFFVNATLPGVRVGYSKYDNLLAFYVESPTVSVSAPAEARSIADSAPSVFLVDDAFRVELDRDNVPYEVVRTFNDFRITRLTPQFLDPRTRFAVVTKRYLIALK